MNKQRHAKRRFKRLFKEALEQQTTGSVAKAQQIYTQALAIAKHPSVYVNLGVMLAGQGKPAEAEKMYREAIALDPGCALALNNLGVILSERGEPQEAAECYLKSLALGPTAEAYSNLADIYCTQERYAEAFGLITKALEINPQHPQSLCNAAMVMWSQNQHDAAIATLRQAIAMGAEPKAHVNLGMLLLMTGQYAEGWQEYAWRFAANKIPMRGPATVPIWDGTAYVNGALYVWPEQGLGDEILYASLMWRLIWKAQAVIWEANPRLVKLLQRSAPPNVTVIPLRDAPPRATVQIPAGCLGQKFKPTGRPYLKADEARTATFRAMMPEGKRIVGIAWHSSNQSYGHKKSLTLADFSAFIDNPECHCVSLQYGQHDTGPLHVIAGLDLTSDIDGVAALIKACDVVVTVSNTVAHLAGALGVPCIVLVSDAGGKLWYWGTGDKTPWYSSVRIERFTRSETASGPQSIPHAEQAAE